MGHSSKQIKAKLKFSSVNLNLTAPCLTSRIHQRVSWLQKGSGSPAAPALPSAAHMAFLIGFNLYLIPSSFPWQTSHCHGSPISWVSMAARAASSLMTFPALFTRTSTLSHLAKPQLISRTHQTFKISITRASCSYYLLSYAAILKCSLGLLRPYFSCAQLEE